MRYLNFASTATLAIICTILIGLHSTSRQDSATPSAREAASDSTPSPGFESPELVALRGEIIALRARLSLLAEHQDALAADLDAFGLQPQEPAEFETDANAADFESPPASAPPAHDPDVRHREQVALLASALAQQASDPGSAQWLSDEIERELEEQAPDLGGAELRDTECGETMCRIELAFEDEQARDRSMMRVPALLPWDGLAFFHGDAEDPGRLVFYVAREGEDLPRIY